MTDHTDSPAMSDNLRKALAWSDEEQVEVTQADRDAAAEWMMLEGGERAVRDGRKDNNLLVQAFARHRLAAAPSSTLIEGDAK